MSETKKVLYFYYRCYADRHRIEPVIVISETGKEYRVKSSQATGYNSKIKKADKSIKCYGETFEECRMLALERHKQELQRLNEQRQLIQQWIEEIEMIEQ